MIKDMDTTLLQYYSKYLVGKVFTARKDHYTISKIDYIIFNNSLLYVMAVAQSDRSSNLWSICVDEDTQQNAINNIPTILTVEVDEGEDNSSPILIVIHSLNYGETVLEGI